MTNQIAIAVGLDEARRAELVATFPPDAVHDRLGEVDVLTAGEGGGAVLARRHAGDVVAWFGSGLHGTAPTDGMPDPATLLDGGDDDLVAVMAADAGVTVAAGRGNHTLTAATMPGGGTIVASSLDVVAATLGPDLAVDRGHEDFALGFGFHPFGSTPFRGVRHLPGGVRHDVHTGGTTRRSEVRGPSSEDLPTPGSFDECVEQLYDLFLTTVEEQAGGHRSHALLLGGFDSALVATALRRLGHAVDTYTFGFGDPTYEQRNARELADSVGARHHTVSLHPEPVMDRLRRFGTLYPGIGAQPHYQIHTLLGAEQIAADGFTHAFTGDGCDSIFLGYPTVNARARLGARLSRIPAPIASAARRSLAAKPLSRRLGHVGRMARGMLGNLDLEMPARGHLPTRYLDEFELARLRGGHHPPQHDSIDELRRRLAEPAAALDPIRLAFHGNGLNGQSQAKVDGALRATGVVQLSPFRHPRIKRYVAALPTTYLRPPGADPRDAGKAVLVEMVRRHGLLDDSIISMPKQSPSDSPIDDWYAGPLRADVHELLEGLPFRVDPGALDDLLRPKLAERWYREHITISHHALQAVGLLCSYASFTGRARSVKDLATSHRK